MVILLRIWTGIVAAVTGAALALMIQVAGMLTIRMPIEWLNFLLIAFSIIGFVLGVAVGPRTTTKPVKTDTPD